MVQELDNFRKKYPDYNDLGDAELAGMLAKKYPDAYGDLPSKIKPSAEVKEKPGVLSRAASNLPGSLLEVGKTLVSPKTYEGLGDMARLARPEGWLSLYAEGKDPWEMMKGLGPGIAKSITDRYGSFDKAKETFSEKPAEVLMDVSALLSGGGAGLAGRAGMIGKIGAGASKMGSAIDPLSMAGKAVIPAAKAIGEKVIAPALGSRALTGAETESLLRAAKGTKGFREGMRGKINPEGVYQEAQSALDNIVDARRQDYVSKLPALQQSTAVIDKTPLVNELNTQLSKFGVQFDANGKIIRSTLDRSVIKDASSVIDMIEDWGSQAGDLTPAGFDMLKRNLDSFYAPNKNINAFVTPLRKKSKELIVSKVPEYAEMMSNYEKTSNLVREIKQNLSMGDKASTESGIRKLMSSLRDDNEFRRSLIAELDKAGKGELLDQIAGIRMKGIVPLQHGGTQLAGAEVLAAILGGNPKILGGLVLASPRLVGETANALGRAVRTYRMIEHKRPITQGVYQSQKFTGGLSNQLEE
ncbi:MAG: hypothetical protein LUP94_02695 [Candidatus Methanomethylicus sp.]|nr:hypothetical protein [Candidatus Methanomethylicus sp.]